MNYKNENYISSKNKFHLPVINASFVQSVAIEFVSIR